MSTVSTFEDLEVYQFARELCVRVYKCSRIEPFCRDYALCDQIRRSAGSIMDNIAEGFERGGKKEFIQFLFISKGSAGELRSQLIRAKDLGYIAIVEFDELYALSLSLSKQLGGFIKYLKQSSFKGSKYSPI